MVENVLNSLTSLSDLGLFQKMKIWELTSIIWPLICHPNTWIRNAAVGFISSSVKHLPKTDLWCIIYPMIRPFLRSDIAQVNEESLLQNIETPVSTSIWTVDTERERGADILCRYPAKSMSKPFSGPPKQPSNPSFGNSKSSSLPKM